MRVASPIIRRRLQLARESMNELSRRVTTGAAWMVAARVGDRVIGLVSTIILARLLLPADFGLVIMATVLIGALQLLGAFSFDLALIQNPKAERRHYDTVWTIGLLFATAFALALIVLAAPAASFYSEPRLQAVMHVLAVAIFLEGLTNVGIVQFRKQLQFDKEFRFVLTRKVVGVVVTVVLAFAWRDYWALVAGTLTASIAAVCLSYLWQPYRPRLSLAARSELFSFSRWLLVNNMLGFLYHRAADFILAKGVGAAGLGHYGLAYEIANLPTSELVAPVNRAVFPGYAKISADMAGLRRGFVKVIAMVTLFAIPAAVGLACIADPLVKVVLGPQWVPVIPLVQVLALNGMLSAILSCSGSVYLAVGKPRYVTLVLAAHTAVAVPLIAWATFTIGTIGVAWMLLLTSSLVVPLNYGLLCRAVGLTIGDMSGAIWRPGLAAAVMAIVLWSVHEPLAAWVGQGLILLLALIALGALTYCALVAILWSLSSRPLGAEAFVLERLRQCFAVVGRAVQ
jgi:lipopolysaccharide exporter